MARKPKQPRTKTSDTAASHGATPQGSSSSRAQISAEEFHSFLRELKSTAEPAARETRKLDAFRAAGLRSILVFSGEEQLRIRRLAAWLREQLFPNGGDAVISFFGGEIAAASAADRVVQALRNQSLFAPEQLLIIQDFDEIKAAIAKRVIEGLQRKSPGVLAVLTVRSVKDFAGDLLDHCTIVDVAALSGTALQRWVAKEAQRAGAPGIDSEAVQLLVNCYGSDLTSISQELSKLSLMSEKNEPLSARLVASELLKTPERTSFELVNQMARKKITDAVRLAREILAQGLHPLQLSNFLSRCVRMMLAMKASTEARRYGDESNVRLHSELSNPWFARNLSAATQAFSLAELREMLDLLRTLDLQLKSSGLPPPIAMSFFVQRVASRSFAR